MTSNKGRRLRLVAALMGIALIAAACSSDKKTPAAAGAGSGSGSSAAPASAPKGPPGALAGMKGTTPLVDLPADFKAKLDGQGLNLDGVYNYGPESYDAVVVIALAADVAKTDGIDYA